MSAKGKLEENRVDDRKNGKNVEQGESYAHRCK
jgi:hypothetical protein